MPRKTAPALQYASMLQVDVPQSRNGKHHTFVGRVIEELSALPHGRALKVPLDGLADRKENVRSALNRETHKRGMEVRTASDESFLYIWRDGA